MQDDAQLRDDIRRQVLDYLAERLSMPSVRDARDDVVLRDCGLDSFGTFEFLLGLEKRLSISLSEQHLDARRCRSVNGIVSVLAEARAADVGQ